MADKTIHLLLAGDAQTTSHFASVLTDSDSCFQVRQVSTAEELETVLFEQPWKLIITCFELQDFTALELHAKLQTNRILIPLLLIADSGSAPIALQRIQRDVDQCILDNDKNIKRLPGIVFSMLRRQQFEMQRHESEELLRESEERYLDIFDNTSDLVQCIGLDGRFLYTNKAWRETLGYTESEVASLTLPDILHEDSMLCCQSRFEKLKQGETLTKIDFKFITKHGDTVHLTGDYGSIIKNGQAISTRGIFRNITESLKIEQALVASETRYQSLFENAPDINAIINRDGIIVSINRRGAESIGYSSEELVGAVATDTVCPEYREAVFDYIMMQFQSCNTATEIEYKKLRKDGTSFWAQMRVSSTPDENGKYNHLLLVCRDITETRKLSDQLIYQATHDDLTKLVNRREFESRLSRVLSEDQTSRDTHALCYLDLDQFKIINDACGHLAGDELLRQVSTVLSGQVRSRDTLARLGGDEFAVLMEHCGIDQAEQLANRFRKVIEEFRFHWKSRCFSIGVSIGVVPINETTSTMEEVMGYADSACYAAKDAGRNRVFVY